MNDSSAESTTQARKTDMQIMQKPPSDRRRVHLQQRATRGCKCTAWSTEPYNKDAHQSPSVVQQLGPFLAVSTHCLRIRLQTS